MSKFGCNSVCEVCVSDASDGARHGRWLHQFLIQFTAPSHLRLFCCSLIEEAEDLATSVPPLGLLVIHDAVGSGEDDVAKLARREKARCPLLRIRELHVETG